MSAKTTVRSLRAENLNEGDRLVLAFPQGTKPHQVRALLEDGHFIADTTIIDHPESCTTRTGEPLGPDQVAQRIALPVTYAALGQTTVLLALALPDTGDDYTRHVSRYISVRIEK